ncbi:MAG: ornithine cyclodeaminase family protein [Pirellulales bacterium]
MLILNSQDVRQALPMPQAIEAMKQAFAALSAGQAIVPPRAHLALKKNAGISLVMPAYLDDEQPDRQALAVKVVSLFDRNRDRGLARIQAAVMAFEPDTGRLLALLEGATLTAIRTAAASGAATNLLARPDCRTAAVLGAGVQARAHLQAMLAVRPLEQIRIHSRSPDKAHALAAELAAQPECTARLIVAGSAREAVRGADLICCTTTSPTPVFDDADLAPGAHINAVGSFTPQVREVPPETVCRAAVFVDSRAAAWEEAGDLIQPLEAGLIGRGHIRAELGELVLGRQPGRASADEITFFKSVGIAVQDAAAARVALKNAVQGGLGHQVDW